MDMTTLLVTLLPNPSQLPASRQCPRTAPPRRPSHSKRPTPSRHQRLATTASLPTRARRTLRR
ncbi:hypothetical protein BC567DRAFT_219073 [Phyllosticta citribraziliensis]